MTVRLGVGVRLERPAPGCHQLPGVFGPYGVGFDVALGIVREVVQSQEAPSPRRLCRLEIGLGRIGTDRLRGPGLVGHGHWAVVSQEHNRKQNEPGYPAIFWKILINLIKFECYRSGDDHICP